MDIGWSLPGASFEVRSPPSAQAAVIISRQLHPRSSPESVLGVTCGQVLLRISLVGTTPPDYVADPPRRVKFYQAAAWSFFQHGLLSQEWPATHIPDGFYELPTGRYPLLTTHLADSVNRNSSDSPVS